MCSRPGEKGVAFEPTSNVTWKVFLRIQWVLWDPKPWHGSRWFFFPLNVFLFFFFAGFSYVYRPSNHILQRFGTTNPQLRWCWCCWSKYKWSKGYTYTYTHAAYIYMVYIYICCILSIRVFSFNIPLRYPKITKIISYMICLILLQLWEVYEGLNPISPMFTIAWNPSGSGKKRGQNCLPPKSMDWFEKRYFCVGVFLKHFWHKYDTKTFWWSLVLLFFWRKWPNIGFNHLEVWKSADVVVGLLTWLMMWNTRGKGDVLMQSLIKLAQWLCTK